jgi:hypothetical protein
MPPRPGSANQRHSHRSKTAVIRLPLSRGRDHSRWTTRFITPFADNLGRIREPEVAWGATGSSKAVAPTTEKDRRYGEESQEGEESEIAQEKVVGNKRLGRRFRPSSFTDYFEEKQNAQVDVEV